MTISVPINREAIKAYLPHRDPMLFVDKVTKLTENSITAESFANPEAGYFKGHFPHMPIQPGVLIVETSAQVASLLVALSHGVPDGKFLGFSSIDKARFKRPVYPGETMIVEVEIVQKRLPFYKFSGTVSVNGKTVTIVSFSAALMTLKSG